MAGTFEIFVSGNHIHDVLADVVKKVNDIAAVVKTNVRWTDTMNGFRFVVSNGATLEDVDRMMELYHLFRLLRKYDDRFYGEPVENRLLTSRTDLSPREREKLAELRARELDEWKTNEESRRRAALAAPDSGRTLREQK